MAGDWIKAHRSMMDSAIWDDEWLVKLWMWCLFKANYQDRGWRGTVIKRGQFVTGRATASDELRVSPSKWYRGMLRLQELGNITLEANSKRTTVTVCNYTSYQDQRDVARTASEQPANSQRTQEKNIPDTDTDTEAGNEISECWTDAHPDLAEPSLESVDRLPLGKLDPTSVFKGMTDDMLRNHTATVSWFRRQLSARAPILGRTMADLLLCLCASLKACEPSSKKPVAVFVNVIRNKHWQAVSRYRERAEEIIKKELKRDSVHAN